MKTCLLILLALAGLSHAAESPPRIMQSVPASILQADMAAGPDFTYQASDKRQTLYFDQDGNAVEKPVKDGFYRQIVGSTPDGRTVVEDFYQDSGSRHTSPTILIAKGNIHELSYEILDNRTIWYRQDGSVAFIAEFKNGIQTSPFHYYHNGTLAMQFQPDGTDNAMLLTESAAPGKLAMQSFHHNGKPLMRGYKQQNGVQTVIFYRDDGTAIAMRTSTPGGKETISAWNDKGKEVTPGEIQQEFAPLGKTFTHINQRLAEDMKDIFRLPAADNFLKETP